jgi:hypothetical protein
VTATPDSSNADREGAADEGRGGPSTEQAERPARVYQVATWMHRLVHALEPATRRLLALAGRAGHVLAALVDAWRGRPRRQWSPRALRLWSYAAPRLLLAAAVTVIVLLGRCAEPPAPPPTAEGLAGALGARVAGLVATDELVWDRSRGTLWDALFGRDVLFLAANGDRPERDLYRAVVRVSREGRIVGVGEVWNLTDTPLGDDRQLTAFDGRIAVVTTAFDAVQGVTVLDTRGPDRSALAPFDRWVAKLQSWLEHGSSQGLGRVEVVVTRPAAQLDIELRDGALVMALGEPPSPALLHLDEARLETGGDHPVGLQAWLVPPAEPDARVAIRGLVERWAGTRWLERLEGWWSPRPEPGEEALVQAATEPILTSAEPSPLPDGTGWPPSTPQPASGPLLDGEGIWRQPAAVELPASPGVGANAASYLLESRVRAGQEELSEAVYLVAIDTRQLRLGIVAGYDRPRPRTGPRGSGRLPTALPGGAGPTVVAAFSGAGQDENVDGGMVQAGRVLVPPTPRAPALVVDREGRSWLGAWPLGQRVPRWVDSLRQGSALPTGGSSRAAPGATPALERSALCLSRAGHLIYAWAPHHTASELGTVLARCGCERVVGLDRSPGRPGFVFLSGEPTRAASGMSIDPGRFSRPSSRDFVYLALRDSRPATPLRTDLAPDGHRQPAPSWLPAVRSADRFVLGAEVHLHAFSAGRLVWQIRPGRKERAGWTADGALPAAEVERALVAISLGVGLRKDNRRGLVLDGKVALPVRPDLGALVTSPSGKLEIGLSVADLAPPGDASELPLLADEGQLRAEARAMGPFRRRAAACLLSDGTFVVASSEFDSGEANATALLGAGCRRVVELNRGAQVAAFVRRAGEDAPLEGEYDATVLYGLERPAGGLARPLESHPAVR